MTPQAPPRPVTRLRVLLGALLLFALLAGVVAIGETLRHGPANVPQPEEALGGDVRDDVVCPPTQPGPAAVDVSSDDLLDCPATYDGRVVRYRGEVVGALLRRAGGVWTQLNDDVYAGELGPLPAHRDFRGGNAGIGVLLPTDLADGVGTVGGPAFRGDVLTVVGTFHRVDPDSREVAVIRVRTGSVTARGEPIHHEPMNDRRITGIVLALAAAGVTVAQRRARSW